MITELRLAARRLLKERWTTLTAILTVALGSGVSIAVFAAAYGLILRPLPYDEAGRLWLLDVRARSSDVDNWRSELRSFDRLTAYASERIVIRGLGDTRQVRGAYVDGWFFDTVTARPLVGRVLSRGATGDEAVISARLARAAAIPLDTLPGHQITAGGAALTVVGVLPETFSFPAGTVDIWMPARVAPPVALDRLTDARSFRLAGSFRPGVTVAGAADEVARVRGLLQPDAAERRTARPLIESAYESVTRDLRSTVTVLAAAAGGLWIVTCANLATILIGRTIARRRELAVCHALGAGVWRRVASLFSESVLITFAGTILGIALASAAIEGTGRWAHELNPRPGEIRLDATPAAFAAVSSVVLAIFATLLALPASRRRAWNLHGPNAGVTLHDRRARGALLIMQVALVIVLISGGALLVRTLAGLLRTDLGLDRRDTIVSELVLTPVTAYKASDRWPVLQELLMRIRTIPGVRFAGAGSSLPPEHEQLEISVNLTGPRGEQSHRFSGAVVTPGYLEAIGARLRQGRYFQQSDLAAPPSVILSKSLAGAVLEGSNVIGKELPFSLPGVSDRRRPIVVGVVDDIRYSGLETAPGAAIYIPWHLAPMGQGFLAVQASGADGPRMVTTVRTLVRELDPALPHMPMRSIDEVIERSIGVRRVAALLGATLALLAFGVALVGLAGNVLRSVVERRRELAIRITLGATPSAIIRLAASRVVLLAGTGLVLGTAAAVATGGMLRSLVEGVLPYDLPTLLTVALFVIVASLGASYVPARLAVRIDAAEVLKSD